MLHFVFVNHFLIVHLSVNITIPRVFYDLL